MRELRREQLNDLRGRLFKSLRLLSLTMGFLLWLVTTVRDLPVGHYVEITIYSCVMVLAVLFFFLDVIPLRVRWWGVCSFAYLIGFFNMFMSGPFGSGTIWLIAACALTNVFFGRQAGVVAIVFSLAVTLIIVYSPTASMELWASNKELTQDYIFEWLLDFAFILLIAILPGAYLIHGAEWALTEERRQRKRADLLNTQLKENYKALATLNDTVANSLNKPMRMIHFNAELLDDSSLNPEEAATISQRIRAEATHVSRLIANSQRLSRIHRGNLQRRLFSLGSILSSAISQLEYEYKRKISLQWSGSLHVYADRDLMAIFFEYLLSSMLFHSEPAEPLTGSLTQDEEDNQKFMLKVQLTRSLAEYINEEFIPLYSPFIERGASVTGTELVMAQQIVHLHEGLLEVDATEDQLTIDFSLGDYSLNMTGKQNEA